MATLVDATQRQHRLRRFEIFRYRCRRRVLPFQQWCQSPATDVPSVLPLPVRRPVPSSRNGNADWSNARPRLPSCVSRWRKRRLAAGRIRDKQTAKRAQMVRLFVARTLVPRAGSSYRLAEAPS